MTSTQTKINEDLNYLSACLREVLTECGEDILIPYILFGQSDIHLPPNQHPPVKTAELSSLCFQLLNMVEENVATQYRRAIEDKQGLSSIPGLWGQTISKCLGYGLTFQEISERLPEILCESVLTAHPTEAKRATVLEVHRELYILLVKRENGMWTKYEQFQIREEIKQILERLWRTGEIYLQKPDITSERKNIEYYLKNVFPDALSLVDLRFKQAWVEAGGDQSLIELPTQFPNLSFGNWVGGDRDGHPFVTPEITKNTLENFNSLALALHKEKISDLTRYLSLSDRLQTPPKILIDRIKSWAEEMGEAGKQVLVRNPDEPWRQYCSFLSIFLANGINPEDYKSLLAFLRMSLESIGAIRIAEQLVFPLERIYSTFGFHMAKTDIRQNSAYHAIVIEQILKASGEKDFAYREWDEAKKISFLSKELGSPRPFLLPETPLEQESASLLGTYRVLRNHINSFGSEGIGSFIVSMTKDVSDLLLVYLFLRETGLLKHDETGILLSPFQVVPLFETIKDLENGPKIFESYLSFGIVKSSLKDSYQHIMLGYSDSNKDGGIFASRWALYRAESSISQIANVHGIKVKFFHGRGGTISRGGGKTHKFLDALPHGSLSGQIRMTVQGETIAQQFANKMNAAYNLELYLATTTKVTLRHHFRPKKIHPAFDIVNDLAKNTFLAYTHLLQTDGFIDFYSQATPIDAIERSRIGSRPARRTGKRTFHDLRAIPWVFSWNQSRFYLPNWYGVGSSLQSLLKDKPEKFSVLKHEIKEWHFLNYLIKDIETGLFSADPTIFSQYADLVSDESLRNKIHSEILKEYRITEEMLSLLREGSINERRPAMMDTISLRHKGLAVLHTLQIHLLEKWRKDPDNESLLNELLLTVNAIASGLRTTG